MIRSVYQIVGQQKSGPLQPIGWGGADAPIAPAFPRAWL